MVIFNTTPNGRVQPAALSLRCTTINAHHDAQETPVMDHSIDIQHTEIETAVTIARRERALAFHSFFSSLFAWFGHRTDGAVNGLSRPTCG
jgi:hypothetical protein